LSSYVSPPRRITGEDILVYLCFDLFICYLIGEVLKIQWSDHEGEIPIEFLIENSYFENENNERFSWIRKQVC